MRDTSQLQPRLAGVYISVVLAEYVQVCHGFAGPVAWEFLSRGGGVLFDCLTVLQCTIVREKILPPFLRAQAPTSHSRKTTRARGNPGGPYPRKRWPELIYSPGTGSRTQEVYKM